MSDDWVYNSLFHQQHLQLMVELVLMVCYIIPEFFTLFLLVIKNGDMVLNGALILKGSEIIEDIRILNACHSDTTLATGNSFLRLHCQTNYLRNNEPPLEHNWRLILRRDSGHPCLAIFLKQGVEQAIQVDIYPRSAMASHLLLLLHGDRPCPPLLLGCHPWDEKVQRWEPSGPFRSRYSDGAVHEAVLGTEEPLHLWLVTVSLPVSCSFP